MGRMLAVGTTHAVLVSTSDDADLGTIWKFWTQFTNLRGHANIELGARMALGTVKTARGFACASRLWHFRQCSANDRAVIDIVGDQPYCRHHASDDGAFDVFSSRSIRVATKGRSPPIMS